MQDKCVADTALRRVGNGMFPVSLQQIVHTDRPIKALKISVLGLLDRCQHRIHGDAGYRDVKHDDVIDAQLRSLNEKIVDQIRLGKIIRDYEVRQFFAADGFRDLVCKQGAVGRNQGDPGAYHIQPVKRKDRFG